MPPVTTRQPLQCDRCHTVFGYSYEMDGVFVGAQVGGVVVQSMHGACATCGKGIHFGINTKEMVKLFGRYTTVSPYVLEFSD